MTVRGATKQGKVLFHSEIEASEIMFHGKLVSARRRGHCHAAGVTETVCCSHMEKFLTRISPQHISG